MSSRTENDDPWLRLPLRTAECGPRRMLPDSSGIRSVGMTPRLKPDGRRNPDQDRQPPLTGPARERDGWQILSYLLGGMILYGGIGWLIGHWTGITILFPLGMILGIGLSKWKLPMLNSGRK